MGAFSVFLNTVIASLKGPIPLGGTLIGTSEGVPPSIAQQIRGGFMALDTLETLVDLPYDILQKDMEVVVSEYEQSGGNVHPRTRYYLRQMPPTDTKVGDVVSYLFADYWAKVEDSSLSGETESQYAPSFEGKRPRFLVSEISSAAYQAGYPTTETFTEGNPVNKIWSAVGAHDPLLGHAWIRQRPVGTVSWGIPISLNAQGDYEQNQYLDVIFKWVAKPSTRPDKPVQPADYNQLPAGWDNTPGDDYETRIATEDLYRSEAIRNPHGVLKSSWTEPILVSSDPNLVRYGNTPGSPEFLDDDFWRGYFTPGLDTHQASRPTSISTDWTIRKIDQENGEYPDFVFKNFDINTSDEDLLAAVPTSPYPIGGDSPNDASDSPLPAEDGKILYVSKSIKFPDGSFKTPWSLWKRFDGLDVFQAGIVVSPGDTFFQSRVDGTLQYSFPSITLTAKLFKGNQDLTTGINLVKWYRGATLIVFDGTTRKALNLGVSFNQYHEVSIDGLSLTINPEGIEVTQEYKVGIDHTSRDADYEDNILLKDTTDDGSAFAVDIRTPNGTIFKNQDGLYNFVADFFKGGVLDNTDVVFSWTIKNALGVVITGGLRNVGGVSVGSENYAASAVYVDGEDIDQFATLILTATFGEIVRTDTISLADVADAVGLEVLYWGYGSTDPGSPTDFTPRTLTKAEVLALTIDYSETATGAWYVIHRVGGEWGGEIKLRSESARANGAISLPIFKNVEFAVDGAPGAPAVPGAGSIIPAGWSQAPVAFAGSEDRTYISYCIFILRTDVDADAAVLTRDNYFPSGAYSMPTVHNFKPTAEVPGDAGENGWSPVLRLETDNFNPDGSQRVVVKVIDWTGGTGTKPSADTVSSYIGTTGLTTKADALNIGGPKGSDALVRPQYIQSAGVKTTNMNSVGTAVPAVETERSVRVVINNTSTQSRSFLIDGSMPFREANVSAWCVLKLRGKLGDQSAVTENAFPTIGTLLDANLSEVNVGNPPANTGGHVLRVQDYITLSPGQKYTVVLTTQAVYGEGAFHGTGYIRVVGI